MKDNEMKSVYEMLELLSQAPDSQLDKSITKRLKNLIGKTKDEIKTEVVNCINDCVFSSLSSTFALKTLHILHEVYLDGQFSDFNNKKDKNI